LDWRCIIKTIEFFIIFFKVVYTMANEEYSIRIECVCVMCVVFLIGFVCIYGSSASSVTATGSGICMSSGSGAGSSVCTGSSSCMGSGSGSGSGSGTGSTVCIGSGSTTGSGACMGSGAVWLLPDHSLSARDLFSGLILITNDLI
jgi:hypothetical protein